MDLKGLMHDAGKGKRNLLFTYSCRSAEPGIQMRTGSGGDNYDNVLAYKINALYMKKLIKPSGPGRYIEDVQIVNLEGLVLHQLMSAFRTELTNHCRRCSLPIKVKNRKDTTYCLHLKQRTGTREIHEPTTQAF